MSSGAGARGAAPAAATEAPRAGSSVREPPSPPGLRAWPWVCRKIVLVPLAVAFVLLLLLSISRLLGLDELLDTMISEVVFFHTRSWNACLIYIAAYIVSSLLCVPLTPFEILTGFIFGLSFGICLDIIGRVTGAVLSFGIARMLACSNRDVCPCVTGARVMKGISSAVEEQGLKFLVLFNLAYVPVAVKNYGLGFVPEVPLYKFVLAIFIVEIPMASIWAFIGSTAAHELEAEGISLSNATAVNIAITGAAGGSSQTKLCLLLLGLVSIVAVMRLVQNRVEAQLAGDSNQLLHHSSDPLEGGGSSERQAAH